MNVFFKSLDIFNHKKLKKKLKTKKKKKIKMKTTKNDKRKNMDANKQIHGSNINTRCKPLA
jgi:hypothetical protein